VDREQAEKATPPKEAYPVGDHFGELPAAGGGGEESET